MSYNEQLIERAKREISSRKQRAEQEAKSRRDELVTACPELDEIEREIAKAGLEAIKAISMGANAQDYIKSLATKNLAQQQHRKDILKNIGIDEDYLEVKYYCPICEDRGTVDGKRCECFKSLLKKYAYDELSKCSPIKLSSFSGFRLDFYPEQSDSRAGISPRKRMTEVLSYCRNWADDFDRQAPSVLMYGATGLGKTHLSLAMAKTALDKGYGVVYGSTQNLLSRLEREKFGRSNDGETTEQALLECDLLILDDLGAEFSTSFTISSLYNIINTRMMTGLPVIINTNLSFEDIEAKYTQRISSRIIGDYTPIEFFGRDIRQLKSM
ncbi:MAG: ATP-binding protein [Oscillospiraceae bacterium]